MRVPLKIFIAGGSGFIGRHLIKAFRAHNHEVYGLARDRTRGQILESLGCIPIIGNLLTNGPWERTIEHFDVAVGCTKPGKRGQAPALAQLAEAYVLAAEEMGYAPRSEDRPVPQNINIVDDEPDRQKDWMASVARVLEKPIPASIPAEEAVAQAGQLWVESVTCSGRVKNEKAKAMGWKPQYPSIQQGLPAAIDAVRKG